MKTDLAQLQGQKYINVESYRKNGSPVQTPMWFAEEKGTLFVYSLANAGKVKRIRNNPRVRFVPCDMRGVPKGSWIEAEAKILGAAGEQHGHSLLNQKYGLLKRAGDLFSSLRKRKRVVIAIQPKQEF